MSLSYRPNWKFYQFFFKDELSNARLLNDPEFIHNFNLPITKMRKHEKKVPPSYYLWKVQIIFFDSIVTHLVIIRNVFRLVSENIKFFLKYFLSIKVASHNFRWIGFSNFFYLISIAVWLDCAKNYLYTNITSRTKHRSLKM